MTWSSWAGSLGVDMADLLLAAALILLLSFSVLILGWVVADIANHVGRQRADSEEKARALLKQWLSPTQLARYERDGYFEVVGCHSGKRYRIRRGRYLNVEELDERGATVTALCFGPTGELPIADVMLAQKIALENGEEAALAVANRRRN
jgi:hypothetical protein